MAANSTVAPARLDRVRARLDGWGAGRSFLAVLAVLLALYLPSATYDYRVSVDAAMAAMPAWSLVEHGTLDLTPYEDFLEQHAMRSVHVVQNDEGAWYSNRTIGVIAWGVPFYAMFSPWISGDMPFPMYPAAIAGAVAAALAMAVLHLVLRRVVSPFEAVVAALVAGLATGTWSVSADGLWPHGPSQLWLACGLMAMATERFATVGASFGLALLVRPYNALAAAVAGLGESLARRSPWPAARVGAFAVLGLGIVLVFNARVFGSPSLSGGYGEINSVQTVTTLSTRWTGGRVVWNFLGAFVDPQRGMLWYSPFLVMLVPGLRVAWRGAAAWVRSAAVAGVVVLLAQYWVQLTQGGSFFFGYRYPLDALMLAAPLLVLSWKQWVADQPRRQRVFRVLVVLALSLQVLGAVVEPYKL